jgi:glycosyltransferase involved in cell wall biosynthesis
VIVGMMRIKNEARWIRAVLESALKVCERIYVLDDHSTDGTFELCQQAGDRVRVFSSTFHGIDESRDKNWLLEVIRLGTNAEWVLAIDGDELLMDHAELIATAESGRADCYALRVLYLWDRKDQVRTDGVYGRFWRPSLFRLGTAQGSFRTTPYGGNFHCGNVPRKLFAPSRRSEVRLLHFGYMNAVDRRHKFNWYNEHDPNNAAEDQYVHMIQGDKGGPAAHSKLKHAGPLELAPLEKPSVVGRPSLAKSDLPTTNDQGRTTPMGVA